MKRSRPSDLLQLLGALFTLFWLYVLLSGGWELLPSIVILLLPALFWFIYDRWKQNAPPKPEDRVTEPTDVTFDADAALKRYLAAKEPQASRRPGEQQGRSPVRPVFGAKKNRSE